MKWRLLSGDVSWETYGGKFVAGPFDNGDFQYWFVLEAIEWECMVGTQEAANIDGTHNVCLSVVAPSECPAEELQQVIDSYGLAGTEIDDPLVLVDLLHGYGIRACVWDKNGNLRDLLKEGKKQAIQAELLFGFAMDRPQNALGATGWDLVKGDPTCRLDHVDA